MAEPTASSHLLRWLAAASAAVLGLGLGLAWLAQREEGVRAPVPAAPRDAPARPGSSPAPEAGLAIRSGETLELPVGSLPSSGPLVLSLVLAEPSLDSEPRPTRVLAPDGRILEQVARIEGEDRQSVRLELESQWLTPGRYIVEVQTTERSHFPLRRYAIEVR